MKKIKAVWILAIFLGLLAGTQTTIAQVEKGDFSAEQWELKNARIIEKFGRTCLVGSAFLKGCQFSDGIIEVDIYMLADRRAYPGVLFRIHDEENYERVYLRPHRAPFYGDAVQYLPGFNGADSWQLYNGDGVTARADIPKGNWVTLKIEVLGTQARVFLGESAQPVLEIYELERGKSAGTIGLMTGMDGAAFFSNFRYRAEQVFDFPASPPADALPGMLRDWQISPSFMFSQIDMEKYPQAAVLKQLPWRPIRSAANGMVDFSRHLRRQGPEPETVLARTTIHADSKCIKKYNFGYSDLVTVFLNGQPVFSGNSAYRSRESSFLGVVGPNDSLYLPLRKGENELLLMVAEVMGGWGFLVQDAASVVQNKELTKAWETAKTFAVPESAAWDNTRNVFYVSNYDGYHRSRAEGQQTIARISPDGKKVELRWMEGLFNPTGLAVHQDRLYAVERSAVAVIDIQNKKIINRITLPGVVFPNDIAIDPSGTLYISDSAAHAIFRVTGETAEVWLQGGEIANPNGLCLLENELLVGNNGDRSLKAVTLDSRKVRTVARFRSGVIDGIAVDGSGSILLSHNEGRLYRIGKDGIAEKILDTTATGTNLADFAFAAEKNLLLFPTFMGNSLVAYQLKQD